MPETPLTISIALCTFNGAQFLGKQLESLARQTRLPMEVIIGDDVSSDSTVQIAENWARTVPFEVRIHRNSQNCGYEENFNRTMRECRGDVIFPADQDDVWFPEKLETMVNFLEKNPDVGVVYCRRNLIDQNDEPISERMTELFQNYHPTDASYFWDEFSKDFPDCAGCMLAIRREIVRKMFPFPKPWAHDTWIYVMGPFFTKMVTLPVSLMNFRRHTSNASALGREPDWANGRNVYYLTSVGQFRAHTLLREELKKQLAVMPDTPYRRGYLRYLRAQEAHFGNRVKVEDHFFRYFHLAFWELLTGRYFRHQQPFRSFLFDVKEGLLNALKNQKKT